MFEVNSKVSFDHSSLAVGDDGTLFRYYFETYGAGPYQVAGVMETPEEDLRREPEGGSADPGQRVAIRTLKGGLHWFHHSWFVSYRS